MKDRLIMALLLSVFLSLCFSCAERAMGAELQPAKKNPKYRSEVEQYQLNQKQKALMGRILMRQGSANPFSFASSIRVIQSDEEVIMVPETTEKK